MTRVFILFALVISLLPSHAYALPNPCSALAKLGTLPQSLSNFIFQWRFPESQKISPEKLALAKNYYSTQLSNPSESALRIPKELEEKMGFIEAVMENTRPFSEPSSISNVFEKGSKRVRWAKLLRSLDFKKGLRKEQEDELLAIAFLNRLDGESFKSLAKNDIEGSVGSLIRHEFEDAVLRKGLANALQMLEGGKAITTRGIYSQIKQKVHLLSETLFTAAGALPMVYGGPPLYFPKTKLISETAAQKALIDRALVEGLDKVYPEFEALYRTRGRVQLGWNHFRRVYHAALLSIYLYSSFQEKAQSIADANQDEQRGNRAVETIVTKYETPQGARKEAMGVPGLETTPLLAKTIKNFSEENGRLPTEEEITFLKKILDLKLEASP